MGVEGPINQNQQQKAALPALNRDTSENVSNDPRSRMMDTQAVIQPSTESEHQSIGERAKDFLHRAVDSANSAAEKLGNVLLPLDDMDDENVQIVKSPEEQKGKIWQAGGKDNIPAPDSSLPPEPSEKPSLIEKAGHAFETAKHKCEDAMESVKSALFAPKVENNDQSIKNKELDLKNESSLPLEKNIEQKQFREEKKLPALPKKQAESDVMGDSIFHAKIGSTLCANSPSDEWEMTKNVTDECLQGECPESHKQSTIEEQSQPIKELRLNSQDFPPLPSDETNRRSSEFQEEQRPLLQKGVEEDNRKWVDVVKSGESSEENIPADNAAEDRRDTLYGTM